MLAISISDMQICELLGTWLKEYRRNHGLTLSRIADAARKYGANWRAANISRMEAGGNSIDALPTLLTLFAALNDLTGDDLKLSTPFANEVQAWVSAMGAERSATIVRRAYDVLNGVCKLAVKDGVMRRNPCEGVQLPRKTHKARTYLTVEQLLALADAAGEHRAVILTLGFCGLRFGELRALRVEDVDVERSRLLVRHSVVRVNGVYVEGLPKTHERREVPVAPSVMNAILGECVGKQHDDLLFPGNAHGRWLGEQSARGKGWYARAIAVAGVPALTMHDLRHTAASIAISSGANVKAVQRMLGHKTAAMTLDTYADLFDTDLDAVAMDIERRLNEVAEA